MKRMFIGLLALLLVFNLMNINISAAEIPILDIVVEHNGIVKNLSVVESGEDLLFTGTDLAALGGFDYEIIDGNAYFTRGMKKLRVNIKDSELFPFEDISLLQSIEFEEKIQQVEGEYYFSGAEMLPWLNVSCNLIEGRLDVDTDAFSIWEIVPEFNLESVAFDFVDCCQELGVSGKYVKAAAYMRGKGLDGMFWDIIPVLGGYVEYCDLFDDIMLDQSSTRKAFDELIALTGDSSYWMELVADSELKDIYSEEMKLLGKYSKILSATSLGAELALYFNAFNQHNENVLNVIYSMEVNAGVYDLPDDATTALVNTRINYTDFYSGLEQKLIMAVAEGTIDKLADKVTGPFSMALEIAELSEITGPDWAEGVNRIDAYKTISEYCLNVYENKKNDTAEEIIQDTRGMAYMYLYACEQNWITMAQYAEKNEKRELSDKYRAMANTAEKWQGKFMNTSMAQENDSHARKEEYKESILRFFKEVELKKDEKIEVVFEWFGTNEVGQLFDLEIYMQGLLDDGTRVFVNSRTYEAYGKDGRLLAEYEKKVEDNKGTITIIIYETNGIYGFKGENNNYGVPPETFMCYEHLEDLQIRVSGKYIDSFNFDEVLRRGNTGYWYLAFFYIDHGQLSEYGHMATSENVRKSNKNIDKEKFFEEANGYWIDTSNCFVENEGIVFDYLKISPEEVYFDTYPGSIERKGKVTEIVCIDDNRFGITLLYPEQHDEWSDYEEEQIYTEIYFVGDKYDKLYLLPELTVSYQYFGDSLEDVIENLRKWKQMQY